MKELFKKVYCKLSPHSHTAEPKSSWPQGALNCGDAKNLELGNNVSFGGQVAIHCDSQVIIGDHSMIGWGTVIHTTTHDYNDHPMWSQRIERPIFIGKHVWIGARSIILGGVKISDYAVVAAGSLVNRHVPEGAIVAGNPARIIKFRDKASYQKEMSISDRSQCKVARLDYLPDTQTMKSSSQ